MTQLCGTDLSFARNNVMFNMGDMPVGTSCAADYHSSIYRYFTHRETKLKGALDYDFSDHRGVFHLFDWYSVSDIRDGLSNTICATEGITGDWKSDNVTTGSIVKGGDARRDVAVPSSKGSGGGRQGKTTDCGEYVYGGTNKVNTAACLSMVSDENRTKLLFSHKVAMRGTFWFDGRPLSCGFTACLPPNSPTCTTYQDATLSAGGGMAGAVFGGASSYHPGGVNVCLMDGSVRFVSDGIDCPTYSGVEVKNGKTLFGIWGAMASKNGGESAMAL